MPDWKFHIGVADKMTALYDIKNVDCFKIGTLMPDVPWMEVGKAVQMGLREYLHLSRKIEDSYIHLADYEMWLHSHTWDVNHSDFWKGYLLHLILDNKINVMWQCACARINVDTINIAVKGYSQSMSIAEAAHLKWNEERVYSCSQFGHLCDWNGPIINWKNVSPYVMDKLRNTWGLKDSDIGFMKGAIDMQVREPSNGDFYQVFSEGYYDNIVNAVISECISIFNMLDILV